MSSKILMPALSPTMTEGIINQWLVKVGDTVKAGDIIAEIETDKATMEVEAVDEGKITHILEDTANKQIPVNSVIAIIDGDESETIENKKKIEKTVEDTKDEEIEKPKQFLDSKISQNNKLAAIKMEVPRSGCITTSSTGKIKTNIGRKRNFNLLTLSIGIR